MDLNSREEAEAVVQAVKNAPWSVAKVKRQDKQRNPAPPFTTSTLQQEASRKLNMTPARTMSIAQQLYEGVDITGEGTVGLITYMRTDSLRLSEEAIAAAKGFIESRYGREYYPPKARHYKTKGNAQDAHEAIRPSDVNLVPEDIKKDLTTEQFRLYKLIWSRFLACQMASAVYDSVSIEAQSAGYSFRASRSELKFSGFTAVYEEGRDDEEEAPQSPLPDLKEGEPLELKGTKEEQHFTQPPARYSVKEGRALRPTPLGEVVTGLMKDKFQDIVDPTFTAQMEEELDKVEEGTANWKKVLSEFYTDFEAELHKAEQELDGERIKVPDEVSEEICPQCGRNLVIKSGRFGRFLACPGWPECDFTMPLVVEMPGKCPKCGGRLLKRTGKSKKTGKQYTYYCCEHLSNKDESKRCDFMTWDVPVKDNCPVCGWTMFKKSGRGFKKPFCIKRSGAAGGKRPRPPRREGRPPVRPPRRRRQKNQPPRRRRPKRQPPRLPRPRRPQRPPRKRRLPPRQPRRKPPRPRAPQRRLQRPKRRRPRRRRKNKMGLPREGEAPQSRRKPRGEAGWYC